MIPATATSVERDPAATPSPTLTLLDLVCALAETGATDREVVAAVLDLLETGRVRLIARPLRHHTPHQGETR